MGYNFRQRSYWVVAMLVGAVGLLSASCAPVTSASAQAAGPVGASAASVTPLRAAAPLYAGSDACESCHRLQFVRFSATSKGKLLLQHPRDELERRGCESCHGPGAEHVATEGKQRGSLIAFGGKSPSPIAARNEQCLQCHEKTARMLWKGSMHESRDLACTDCHTVMRTESERANLRKPTVLETCGRCHAQRKAQQLRNSHMPIGEGKMECTSCHNPHGSANEKMLIASSVNETCYTCHAEKRGPYLWEHPPVIENCANCHDPHGSNKEKLLKVARPRLCQQCHAGTGHPTQPRIVTRATDVPFVFNRECSHCHFNIHGSNHPAGAFFTR